MSDITANTRIHGSSARRAAPISAAGPIAWLRENLFSGWLSTAVTLVLGYLIVRAVMGFVDWAFINAIWSVPMTANGVAQTQACRELHGTGACWAVIDRKAPLHAVRHLSVRTALAPGAGLRCCSSGCSSSRRCGGSGTGR